MSSIFDVPVSLYRDAKDRYGQYMDPVTHQPMRSLSMGDFLFGGYWQDEVEEYRRRLRELTEKLGDASKAKHDDSVQEIKKRLPAATLSGYFQNGRRKDLLTQHTGFIALDIDQQDNPNLDPVIFMQALRDRPETAAILRSCSGSGYFVMVRLAHPELHSEQFYALAKEMLYQRINLDKACSDVTRLRFASWDDAPYINEQAIPYQGVVQVTERDVLQRRHYDNAQRQNFSYDKQRTIALVDGLVKKIVATQTDICDDYHDWVNYGFALSRFDEELGKGWFDAISSVGKGKYSPQGCAKKYQECLRRPEGAVNIGFFIKRCGDFGIRLYEDRSLR